MPTDQAPVTREHRELTAHALWPEFDGPEGERSDWTDMVLAWVQSGEWGQFDSLDLVVFSEQLIRTAQAIANKGTKLTALQSRVRDCITELRATGGDQNVLAWLERGLTESEKAGTNG